MELKHLISLNLLAVALTGGLFLTVYFQRLRDLAFLVLVAATVITNRMDVHFFSMEWYRGTTRGIEVSFLDVLAVCVLLSSWIAPRYRGPRGYWPAGLGFMLLYAAYAAVSAAMSHPQAFGWFEMTKIVRGLIVFLAAAMYLRSDRELRLLVLGLSLAVSFEGMLVLREQFIEHAYRVTGTLGHPNSLSMYLCTVAPVLVASASADIPRWLRRLCLGSSLLAALSVLLTLSRAGLPIFALAAGGALAGSMSWRITWRKALAAAAVLAVVGFFLGHYWDMLMQRYNQDTLAEEYLDDNSTAEGRGVYLRWADAIVHDHFFGIGLNNWSYAVAKTYGPKAGFTFDDYDELDTLSHDPEELPNYYLPAPAHNLGALTLGELGLPGLILFSLVWLRWFQMGTGYVFRRGGEFSRRMGLGIFFALVGVFLQSMTEWTYRQTAIFFTVHLLAGALAGLARNRAVAAAESRAEAEVPALPGPGGQLAEI